VGVQDVRWDKEGTVRAGDFIFSMEKETKIINWEQDFFVHHRTLPAVKCIQFIGDRMSYTGCPRRNGQNFGRVFLMLKYTDITQNTYIQKLNGYGDNGQRSLKL